MDDPHRLERFVTAQDPVFAAVLDELRAGRKRTHWMWFVFPQIAGLGLSETARYFAIASAAEARAYLAHPVLGPRLATCTALVMRVPGRSARDIFGSPDDMKFRSSMTLFAQVSDAESAFAAALGKYYAGEPDGLTLKRLAS